MRWSKVQTFSYIVAADSWLTGDNTKNELDPGDGNPLKNSPPSTVDSEDNNQTSRAQQITSQTDDFFDT